MTALRLKIGVGLAWFTLFVALALWIYFGPYTLGEVMRLIFRFMTENPWAPPIYVGIYTLRALTFFPAAWLTIAAGSLFGFWPGLLFALMGENSSANFAYAVARYFRTERFAPADSVARVRKFKHMLRRNTFATVAILRAAYLPFDLVNYGCGLLRVRWPPYFAASSIGMLPPMVTFVSFGASIRLPGLLRDDQNFSPTELIDLTQLAVSGALLVVSLAIAFWANRRRKQLAQAETAGS